MRNFTLILILLTAFLSMGAVNEQDRAILTSETQLLKNPGFEGGKSAWTASGGTFSVISSGFLFGKLSGSWDSNALNQTLDSVLAPITMGFLGRTCQAAIEYKYETGTAGDYQLIARQFDDSGATEIDVAVLDLEVTGTTSQPAILFFTCPDDVNDDLRIRIQSKVADAGVIVVDDAFIGTGRNTFSISQSELIAHIVYPVASNCAWGVDNVAFSYFSADADCVPAVKFAGSGNVDLTENDLPQIVLNDLKPGNYTVEAVFGSTHDSNAVAVQKGFRLVDTLGNPIGGVCGWQNSNTASGTDLINIKCVGSFQLTSPESARTISLQGYETGTGSVRIFNAQNNGELAFVVRKDPLNAAEAITLETTGWYLDANIGGANPDIQALGTPSAYIAIPNSSLDLVNNNPSVEVQIACNAVASSGTTCSGGDEVIGIATNVPTAGTYKFCFEFSNFTDTDNTGFIENYFQIVETANASNTILQEGNSRITVSNDNSTARQSGGITPVNLCGVFRFGTSGQKTLKVMLERTAAASVLTDIIVADRASTSRGQRDIHVHGFKINESFPTPVFTDLQNSLNSKVETTGVTNPQVFAGNGASGGGVSGEVGDWVSTAIRNSLGNYTWTFEPGVFPNLKQCVVSGVSSGLTTAVIAGESATTITIETYNAAGAQDDSAYKVMCLGH